MSVYIKKFSEIGIADVPVVGGKNASLGEMFTQLSLKGIKVPDGFATTAIPADKIDHLINKIFFINNHSSQIIANDKIKSDNKKWIMPDESLGFIECKRSDLL